MNFDEQPEEEIEIGSDELLSDDNLRLPETASNLVRLHAIRSWLTRQQVETSMELGEAALALQQAMQEGPQDTRPRRRERHGNSSLLRIQHLLDEAQQRLEAYEEAQALLEESVAHVTTGERVLVEYYLALEDLMQNEIEKNDPEHIAWLRALANVQHRVERVGTPDEE